ncbi:DUF1150 domain-containing protein [Thermopetrobacter sp. TC1]|uniref:DUF1150 family protein n=1 Tax=Thermopetrobacter sp. TC1 TaxID=1495045 RepID=UPI00056F242F|nr:DUF1150 domain-containing protein [Thermopetrobacter sp. TC1]
MTDKLIRKPLNPLELARLGGGEIAYIRPIRPAEASRLIGAPIHVEEGTRLYAVCHADGTPLAITDSKAGAIANVLEHDLTPIHVH